MKLIALKDFRNVPELKLNIEDADHSLHVHKGAVFELGAGKTLKDCQRSDQMLIAQLTVAGCVGDANDAKLVEAVNREVELDEKREKAAAAVNTAAANAALVEQLTKLLQGATPSKK